MTEEQLKVLKAIYLEKKRRDRLSDEMGISSRALRPLEREAIRTLLKEYMEMKGL